MKRIRVLLSAFRPRVYRVTSAPPRPPFFLHKRCRFFPSLTFVFVAEVQVIVVAVVLRERRAETTRKEERRVFIVTALSRSLSSN